MKRAELRNLIKSLGGPKVVSAHLRKADGEAPTSQSVSHWKRVPPRHCPALERMAWDRGVRRSDGTPYTCELMRPDFDWAAVRSSLVDVL